MRGLFAVQNSVQSYFETLLRRVPKLYGVLVTDKDGVALVRGQQPHTRSMQACSPNLLRCPSADKSVAVALCSAAAMGDDLKDAQLDPSLSASFTAAAEQSGKLGLGAHLSLDCYYDNYTLVQLNLLPLVVTMLAAPDANVQLLHNCFPEVSRLLEPVRLSVHHAVLQAATQES